MSDYIREVWREIPHIWLGPPNDGPKYHLPIGPAFVTACTEVDHLRRQVENQSIIIRNMERPADEREALILKEMSELRDAISQAWGHIIAWKKCADAGWNVIAGVGGADWSKESADWQRAAEKFHADFYEKCLEKYYQRPTGAMYDPPVK